MDIIAVIRKSLDHAASLPDKGAYPRDVHRNRSKQLVESMALNLREEFSTQPTVRVLSKHNSANREEFGLNELLYDVLVCQTGKTLSAKGLTELTFVTKALWVIESEMARDTREAVCDFNKLVLAASENKLFIGPQVSDEDAFLASLLLPATCCNTPISVALLSHPDRWGLVPLTVRFWQLESGQWRRP